MLEGTFSFIKELLGFSSVNTAEYDIERVKDTAGPGGRIYCLTNRETGKQANIFVLRRDNTFDLSSTATNYVSYWIDYDCPTPRNQPTLHERILREGRWGPAIPLSQEHHDALARYFEKQGGLVIRRYPPPPEQKEMPFVAAIPQP